MLEKIWNMFSTIWKKNIPQNEQTATSNRNRILVCTIIWMVNHSDRTHKPESMKEIDVPQIILELLNYWP